MHKVLQSVYFNL